MKERNVRKERKPKEGKLYRDRKMGKKGRKKENEVSKERRPRKENFTYRKDGTERKEVEEFERKGGSKETQVGDSVSTSLSYPYTH